jgi:hypothetical protein
VTKEIETRKQEQSFASTKEKQQSRTKKKNRSNKMGVIKTERVKSKKRRRVYIKVQGEQKGVKRKTQEKKCEERQNKKLKWDGKKKNEEKE